MTAAFAPSPRTGFRHTRLLGVSSRGGQRPSRSRRDVTNFKGTVTDIGVQRAPGQVGGIEYRIEGKFRYDGPLDLTMSTITFHISFDEYLKDVLLPGASAPRDGNGEMVLTTDNADLVCPEPAGDCVPVLAPLLSSGSSKRTEAKYETPGRFRPPMRVQIKNKDGEYQFNVRLDRGTSPQVLAAPGGRSTRTSSPRIVSSRTFVPSIRPTRASA